MVVGDLVSQFLKEVKRGSQNKLTIDFGGYLISFNYQLHFQNYILFYTDYKTKYYLAVAVSILMTNVVDIGLSNYFGGSKPLILKLGGSSINSCCMASL
ncbi:MAG: hypothetical protein ACLTZB_09025 [Streptococcus salivarius]